MTQLTLNFHSSEFLVSSAAERAGVENTPTAAHLLNIRMFLAPNLQKIRTRLRRSIVITSAYRNPEVNRLVGGVPNSAHCLGLAADIRAAGMSARALALWIAGQHDIMAAVDQLILETSRGVVHVSFAAQARGEVLTQAGETGSATVPGIR